MGKKTGKKAKYETYGGKEVKDLIDSKEIGLSLNNSNSTYYTMIPKEFAGADAKRSKKIWLKSDLDNAVIKFRAIVSKLKGKEESIVNTNVKTAYMSGTLESIDLDTGETIYTTKIMQVKEDEYINWLKKELQNPKELAKKTGIEAFNFFYDCVNKKQITLNELWNNYLNCKAHKEGKNEDEKKKTKRDWDIFNKIIQKTYLEQITLGDVKKYEKFLHSRNIKDKTIHHRKGRVLKIFRTSLMNYEDTVRLQQVINHFAKWENLEVNSSNSIAAKAVTKNNFMKLYNKADKKKDLQLKALLMLCLNTGTYLIEASRLKISEFDLEQQTLMTQRNKTGQCRKLAYLWDRTVSDIKAYLSTRNDHSDILFKARHGGEYKDGAGLRTRIYQLRKECNLLYVEFNHLRDTFQTIANEVGVSQYHSNMVMGHSTGKTSDRYSHRRVHNELREACLKIENDFFGHIDE